jgi:sirohydrochlorin cobaltochelatase
MKRYRHYKKQRALVLSCFGSIIEQQKYLDLKAFIQSKFEDCDVFMAFSSRMVLKKLQKEEQEYKNLAQVLADVDMLGYKHIVVSSVNLYPTDEHGFIKRIVDGFASFSLANLALSDAILTKTKETTHFLKQLDASVCKEDTANLYIIHGTPKLNTLGIDSINYTASFLELINENNFAYSLEGAMPYFDIKDAIASKIKAKGLNKVQIVPLLLVSGNHYIKDMHEIKEDLQQHFEASITPSLTQSKHFNLIELPLIQDILVQNIKETFTKMGISYKKSMV